MNAPAAISRVGWGIDRTLRIQARSHAVPILQLFALAVMVIPADTVIKPIGAQGYPAALIGTFALAAFAAATLLGLHDAVRHRHPIRAALCVLWFSVLASYVLIDRAAMTNEELLAADRLLMQLVVVTGVTLVAAECLHSMHDIRRVLRALTWGGAFCGVVAALQFWVRFDVTPYLRELPGFTVNSDNATIVARGSLNRAAGTSLTQIELGVVAGMLLPLAIYLAIYDTERTTGRRWAPVLLIWLAVITSVSRSGIISVGVAAAVLIVLLPTRQRLIALCLAPLGIAGVFMSAPGVIGTLTRFFLAGTSDDSVKARVMDYPVVERLVDAAPWFGHGGWTYMPENTIYILDNQWLKTAVEFGLVGVLALGVYLVLPLISALVARRHSDDPELRMLCAALAGAALAAALCSLTFDSLSYPMFWNVYALVIGLIGACWRLVAAGRTPPPPGSPRGWSATKLRASEPSTTQTVLSKGG